MEINHATLDAVRNKQGFICDMDGVIYHGNKVLPGVVEFIQWMQESGKRFVFLTNSPEKTPHELSMKLGRMGLEVDADHFYTSAMATAAFLNSQKPGCTAYVIGEAAGTFGLSRPGGSALNDTQVGGLVCAKHIASKEAYLTEENLPDFAEDTIPAEYKEDPTIDYSHLKKKMSQVASFTRDYEGCKALLGEVDAVLSSYPCCHRSLASYYRDKDMLISMKALLEAIISECPDTGSRGGAIFMKNGAMVEENLYYRDYLTVTKGRETEYIRASAVPFKQKPFEYYLSKLDEKNM